jgi:hypothetical protein
LAEALLRTAKERPTRAQVRAYFDEALSFSAVGRQWASAYEQVLHGHRGNTR